MLELSRPRVRNSRRLIASDMPGSLRPSLVWIEIAPPSVFRSKQWIRPRDQRGLRDGDARDQIPAHHVPEWLIEAHSIHVHRDSLGRSKQRRRGVAPVVDIRLNRVPLNFIQVDSVHPPVEKVGEIEGSALFDVDIGRGLDRCRDLVERAIHTGKRRSSYYVDLESGRGQRQYYRGPDGRVRL